jgi:hypothetical protein
MEKRKVGDVWKDTWDIRFPWRCAFESCVISYRTKKLALEDSPRAIRIAELAK